MNFSDGKCTSSFTIDLLASCNSLLALILDKERAETLNSFLEGLMIFIVGTGVKITVSIGSSNAFSGGKTTGLGAINFGSTAIEYSFLRK